MAGDWWTRLKDWIGSILQDPKLNKPETLLKDNVGLPATGTVMAFGHFTTERNLDVVVLDDSRKELTIYVWDRSSSYGYDLCILCFW
jgi:hypothetical protein